MRKTQQHRNGRPIGGLPGWVHPLPFLGVKTHGKNGVFNGMRRFRLHLAVDVEGHQPPVAHQATAPRDRCSCPRPGVRVVVYDRNRVWRGRRPLSSCTQVNSEADSEAGQSSHPGNRSNRIMQTKLNIWRTCGSTWLIHVARMNVGLQTAAALSTKGWVAVHPAVDGRASEPVVKA